MTIPCSSFIRTMAVAQASKMAQQTSPLDMTAVRLITCEPTGYEPRLSGPSGQLPPRTMHKATRQSQEQSKRGKSVVTSFKEASNAAKRGVLMGV